MTLSRDQKIEVFGKLGEILGLFADNKPWSGYELGINEDEYARFESRINRAELLNPWFTESNIRLALKSLSLMLKPEKLNQWLQSYSVNNSNPKTVALIMAGNIPMVGFHDLLCVLMSGNKALIKCSSDDTELMTGVIELISSVDSSFTDLIHITDQKLRDFDLVIATGSNNTARYFDYYFGKYPNIIRKNRNSVAILDGNETEDDMANLGNDIFSFFGLGCRNVSKVFLQQDYGIDKFFKGIYGFKDIVNHNKYANNYDYNKAIWLLNEDEILDNGFLLLKESEDIAAPTASLYFENYNSRDELLEVLSNREDEIQCIVSRDEIPFGKAQQPELWDYADNVDTMAFLLDT